MLCGEGQVFSIDDFLSVPPSLSRHVLGFFLSSLIFIHYVKLLLALLLLLWVITCLVIMKFIL